MVLFNRKRSDLDSITAKITKGKRSDHRLITAKIAKKTRRILRKKP
ncbi:MAG: hypothetical protein K940chlam7_00575 [Chlamydiae bacterium]|nr:hypothetical protein [Chlamydiota bacterium]